MHGSVRQLYKEILTVGKDHPNGLSHVRKVARDEFMKNFALVTEAQIRKAVNKGQYKLKEMIGFIKLIQYRTMVKRYS